MDGDALRCMGWLVNYGKCHGGTAAQLKACEGTADL